MPQLVDPNFARTVVLLCEHSADGAFGLVMNRPSETEAFEKLLAAVAQRLAAHGSAP